MELVPYPFMTAMATDTIAMATEKMGIMESDDGVHTVCDGNGNGENWNFLVLSIAVAVTVWTNLKQAFRNGKREEEIC